MPSGVALWERGEVKAKHSVPTSYNGQEFRSRFEARIAFWLDGLKIKREYEPKSFILKNGVMIWPDFYLPELKTWLEVKGSLQPFDLVNFEKFVTENNTYEAMIITPTNGFWFSNHDTGGLRQELRGHKCKSCGSWFFCGDVGVYSCRHCGFHEGGHTDLWKNDIINQIKSLLKTQMLGEEFYDS
jgi:hypothetical protein